MYVFKPKGVCPHEIHFSLDDDLTIDRIRMVGGGCPGNTELIGRLLRGRAVNEVLPLLEGILCRNGTSCADQLAQALTMVQRDQLQEADPIPIMDEERADLHKLAVVAEIRGNLAGLKSILAAVEMAGAEVIYHLGNLVWPGGENDAVMELAVKHEIRNVQGPYDRQAANMRSASPPHIEISKNIRPRNRDRLLLEPLIRTFRMGERRGVAFYGGFIQDVHGFSDFSPYATEIIMTCNLGDYLRDESVFPALATMTDHFAADIVLFGHTGQWKHVRLGKVDFCNIGALAASGRYGYALVELNNGDLEVHFKTVPAV